jgi:hypothetical protein
MRGFSRVGYERQFVEGVVYCADTDNRGTVGAVEREGFE